MIHNIKIVNELIERLKTVHVMERLKTAALVYFVFKSNHETVQNCTDIDYVELITNLINISLK